jgi:hypothetical protein
MGLGFALAHSLLAARQTRALAGQILGARHANALYRLTYNALALTLCAAGATWLRRQPDRDLYRVPAVLAGVMRAGQVGALALAGWNGRTVGFWGFSGIGRFADLLRGRDPQPEPVAQGPALAPDGSIAVRGPFRFMRHPGNLSFALLFALEPHMTVNRAVIAVLAAVYAMIGSYHEELRLRHAYGTAYDRYRREVPFLLPRLWPR